MSINSSLQGMNGEGVFRGRCTIQADPTKLTNFSKWRASQSLISLTHWGIPGKGQSSGTYQCISGHTRENAITKLHFKFKDLLIHSSAQDLSRREVGGQQACGPLACGPLIFQWLLSQGKIHRGRNCFYHCWWQIFILLFSLTLSCLPSQCSIPLKLRWVLFLILYCLSDPPPPTLTTVLEAAKCCSFSSVISVFSLCDF